jgi:hypothetical protein
VGTVRFPSLASAGAYPKPRWVRRVNWLAVSAYAFTLAVWPAVGLIVWWLVW